MTSALDIEPDIPLVVDLDGTLTVTDTLHEGFAKLLFRAPLMALASLFYLVRGRAAAKRFITQRSQADPATLPYRQDLIAVLKGEKARGRQIHLVTAADQAIADAVAAECALFDTATGSDGARNLKGETKLAFVRGRFADGFLYAGDGSADLPLFQAARGVLLCDVTAATEAAVAAAGAPVLGRFSRPAWSPWDWMRAFRVHQWVKNLLILVPLFVGHAFSVQAAGAVALGFLLLSLLSSATYIINDLADLEADRAHPTKCHRPFASGRLKVAHGLIAAPLMMITALVGAYLLAPAFAASMLGYLVLTLAYSYRLKRIPLLDVFVIGSLFTLRIVMGSEVLGIGHSPWLLSFALAFFLSLALAKRHPEVMAAMRNSTDEIAGRGYRSTDWPITLTFGVGIGLASVVIMLLYMANDATPSGFYHQAGWLYAIPALMTVWLMRVWLLSHRQLLHDDPVVFALRDPASLLLGAAVAVAFYLAI